MNDHVVMRSQQAFCLSNRKSSFDREMIFEDHLCTIVIKSSAYFVIPFHTNYCTDKRIRGGGEGRYFCEIIESERV